MVKKIFTLFIVLYPILSAYAVFGPVDLGVALCALVSIIIFFTTSGKMKLTYPRGYLAFFIYVVFTAIIVTHAVPYRIILYSVLLVLGCVFCELTYLYKYYKWVAVICIVFFLLQELFRLTIGINISGIFTFLPTIYGDSASSSSSTVAEVHRSSSFFLEPSYFSQFLFPLVALELFWNKNKKHMRNALVLTAVIFMIRSGNGILLLGIIWGVWLFFGNDKRSLKRRIILAVVFVVVVLLTYKPDVIMDLLSRSKELSINEANERWQTSGFIRFFRGYYLYALLPFVNQMFGLNPSEIESYMMLAPFGFFDKDASFLNGIQTILCLYGFVGLIFFFRHLYLLGRRSNIVCVVLLIGTIYLLFSESYFICGRMLLTMVLVYLLKYKNEDTLYN